MRKNRLISLSFISVTALAGLIVMQAFWIASSIKNNRVHTREHIVLIILQNNKKICNLLGDGHVAEAQEFLTKEIIDDLKKTDSPLKFNLKIVDGQAAKPEQNTTGTIFFHLHCHTATEYFVLIRCDSGSWKAFGPIFWWASASVLMLIMLIAAVTVSLQNQYKFKKLEKIKSDFVSNMTHELKTPISTISVASEMLMKQDNPFMNKEKFQKYASIIHEENNRLKRLVDKVLQIAIFERGTQVYKFEKIDIHEIVAQAVKRVRMLASEKRGEINFEAKADNHFISGDKNHLLNTFINLLENAVKYSDTAPEISVQTKSGENIIEILIKDNGPGIPEDKKEDIFKQFTRITKSNIHNTKGFGLGLYYVKKVVEAHKGDIKAIDALPRGTIFVIRLPL